MTIAINDIIRIKVFQRLLGQEILNVYFYRFVATSATTPALRNVATSWAAYFHSEVMLFQSSDLEAYRVVVDNLTDGINFEEVGVSYNGGQTGDNLPLHNALTIKLARDTKITRNGSKRLAGMLENDVDNGQLTYVQASIDRLEDFHASVIIFNDTGLPGVDYTLENVIVGRNPSGSASPYDLSRINPVTSATVNRTISSQVSRKP